MRSGVIIYESRRIAHESRCILYEIVGADL